MIRKAEPRDIETVAEIYERVHDCEEAGTLRIGWQRGVYPTRDTALCALEAGDLFVMEDEGAVVASARINRVQVPEYALVPWKYAASDEQVMVLHTLTVDPDRGGKGYGRRFVQFYEDHARANGCPCLRIDTNARNDVARHMYAKLGYIESAVVPCTFNGIDGVNLVCLEKWLGD